MSRQKSQLPQSLPVTVRVRMLCARSGDGWMDMAGDIIEADAEEAARLLAIGAAETV